MTRVNNETLHNSRLMSEDIDKSNTIEAALAAQMTEVNDPDKMRVHTYINVELAPINKNSDEPESKVPDT